MISTVDIEGDIEAAIAARYDFTAGKAIAALNMPVDKALDALSLCVVVMNNGFTVIGHSAPASPDNFSAELGRKLAYDNCIRCLWQLWPLMGFALRERATP